jgi:hypothetical protein
VGRAGRLYIDRIAHQPPDEECANKRREPDPREAGGLEHLRGRYRRCCKEDKAGDEASAALAQRASERLEALPASWGQPAAESTERQREKETPCRCGQRSAEDQADDRHVAIAELEIEKHRPGRGSKCRQEIDTKHDPDSDEEMRDHDDKFQPC